MEVIFVGINSTSDSERFFLSTVAAALTQNGDASPTKLSLRSHQIIRLVLL